MSELVDLVQEAWQAYDGLQHSHPFWSSIATGQVTLPLGDLVSQLIIRRRVNWKQAAYNFVSSPFYSACLWGLMQTGEIVGEHISENPLAKSALGPNLFGHLFNFGYLIHNTIGEKFKYHFGDVTRHYLSLFKDRKSDGTVHDPRELFDEDPLLEERKGAWQRLKENAFDYLPRSQFAELAVWTFTAWNVVQTANYSIVPEQMRVPVVLCLSIPWAGFLAYKSLRGRLEVVHGQGTPPEGP